ncbi:CbiX/SirB N-terminal domain-containing protein [Janibacter sp. DB-40]|uniref:CbiX/SirB N-terminal domain-containing protein n=1 Tax=Janibacter sp. DB-40 TaxID=3028808 RepID=UPI0024070FD9|nr:CbiX/SirB N-terminal domain-containing protein [Janibacter sp. DB-40]
MTTVLLAHGSPDPRHALALERLRERVAVPLAEAGRGPTHLAYIEEYGTRPHELARGLSGEVTLLPLLLTPAFHSRVDVPAAARELAAHGARVRTVPALGGHPSCSRRSRSVCPAPATTRRRRPSSSPGVELR